MRRIGLFIALIAAIVTVGAPLGFVKPAVGAEYGADYPDPGCAPVGDIRFVCGRSAPEDLAYIPGTDWVVTSAYTGAVGLRLISVHDEKGVAILYPSPDAKKKQDMATYGACPGPLSAQDEAKFVAHGINIRKVTDRSFTLYVVHHGGRESIEVFNLDVPRGKRPLLTWIGCAITPDHEILNAVAPLPDGGFVATNTWERPKNFEVPQTWTFYHEFSGDPLGDSAAPGVREKRAAGENTGYVLEWHPQSGWAKVPGSEGSGDNGVEVSKDGKQVYIVVGGGKLLHVSRGDNPPQRDFISTGGVQGDNVKWSADGKTLLVAGSLPPSADGTIVGEVVAVNPNTSEVTDLVELPARFTTGIEIGKDMWLGSSRALRVTVMPIGERYPSR